MPLQTNNRRIVGESPDNVYISTILFQHGELRVNGLCKWAIILVTLAAMAAFTLPSSAQLVSSSGSSFGSSGSSSSSFNGFSGSNFSGFGGQPPLPGIFNGLGGWTGFGPGGIGCWGPGWCKGWSGAVVIQASMRRPPVSGYFGCSPPIIPTCVAPAVASTLGTGTTNAPASSANQPPS
jgi:hypothetical protein